MSASTLRAAAALIRERSHDTAEAWGGDAWSAGEIGYDDRQGMTYDVHARGALVAATGCEELSEHIASWHPAVALAVADLIDTVLKVGPVDGGAEWDATVTLARTYLGELA